jgi:hypothetical protein
VKKLFLAVCLLALIAPVTRTSAQTLKAGVVKFVMPTGVDPIQYEFTYDGQLYTGIPGSEILDPGINLLVPHTNNSGIQFSKFLIASSYAGGITLLTEIGNDPRFNGFMPWVYTPIDQFSGIVQAPTGSVNVGQGLHNGPGDRFFALMHIDPSFFTPAELDAFSNSTFTIQGFTPAAVPEPGTAGMLVGVVAAGGLALRSRRSRKA